MPAHRQLIHPFAPVADEYSKILILGTMPSPATVADGFYYGHPRNRFWSVLAGLLRQGKPVTKEEKLSLLHAAHIALWDVLYSCDIDGADDSSITNPHPNDIAGLLARTGIKRIYTNGGTAFRLYEKLILPTLGVPAIRLPSTSPANAAWTLERLLSEWNEIIKPQIS